MNEETGIRSEPTMAEAGLRVFGYVSGPSLVAILFAAVLQSPPALEVILASSVDFADGLAEGETWFQFYFKIGSRLFVIASVPAAVFAASRWILRNTRYVDHPAGLLLPRLFAVLAFIGYLAALVEGVDLPNRCVAPVLGWPGLEGPSLVLTCQKAITTVTGTALFMSVACLVLVGLFHVLTNAGESGGRAGIWILGVTTGVLFVLGVFFPTSGRLLGPLAVSSAFFAVLAFGLAGLKVFALHHLPNSMREFPLVLVIFFLASANASPEVAPLTALLVILVAMVSAFYAGFAGAQDDREPGRTSVFQTTARWLHGVSGGVRALAVAPVRLLRRIVSWAALEPLEKLGIGLVLLCLGIWGLHGATRGCDTLSGCNRTQGVMRSAAAVAPLPVSPGDAYLAWSGRDEPKAVVVAARGGGLFSAYQSAYYLAARADADPAFRRQLFAISGVSGGSLGAGVYWAVRGSGICDRADAAPDCHRRAVDQILRRDYLSPILSHLYTLDVIDVVVPFSAALHHPIDRSVVLEATINTAVNQWLSAADGQTQVPLDRLLGAISDSWSGDAGVPLLFLNATDIVSGELVVFSPVEYIRTPAAATDGADDPVARARPARVVLDNGNDMSLIDSIVTSARAPGVTPALRVVTRLDGERVRRQLADGASYDQSGIETAEDLVRELQAVHDGEIELVLMEVPFWSPDRRTVATALRSSFMTFVAVWRVRYQVAKARLIEEARQTQLRGETPFRVCTMSVDVSNDVARDFTVSWYLAQSTFDMIRDQIDGTEAAPVSDQGLHCW